MKKLIQSVLKRFDYRIEKLRSPLPGDLIFLLDLALYVLNQRRDGEVRFVQIGANDGVQEDPCYAWIHRFPWQGVLVEPQPKLAAGLREMYRERAKITIEQAVIADRPGQLDLHYLKESAGVPAWATGIASLDYASIAAHRDKIPGFDAAIAKATVPAITLHDLLERHRINSLDFLQIDAEGYDARILATVDFRRIRPPVIAYEDCNLSYEERAACRAMLGREGYHFATWHGDTLACLPEVLPVSDDRKAYVGFASGEPRS
jgi:FkbM family methyltransferase